MEPCEQRTELLQLPHECLLCILQKLQADSRSICSAARAHSKMHHAAVAALSRVCLQKYSRKRFNSVLLYLQHHQHHVTSLELTGLDPERMWVELFLPPCSAVERLVLRQWAVELGPRESALALLAQAHSPRVDDSTGAGRSGAGASSSRAGAPQLHAAGSNAGSSLQDVLGAHTGSSAGIAWPGLDCTIDGSSLYEVLEAACSNQGLLLGMPALTELQLLNCCSTGIAEELAAAAAAGVLPGLTNLEHLVATWKDGDTPDALLTGNALSHLVKLTHLTLRGPDYEPDTPPSEPVALPLLHHLTALRELNVEVEMFKAFTAAAMSGLQHLTLLNLGSGGGEYEVTIEPAALAEVPNLQHLVLRDIAVAPEGQAGVVQFFSHLGGLHELTHLQLNRTPMSNTRQAPAAAFGALTASSKLESLELRKVPLPGGAWQHMFKNGQVRSALRSLAITSCGGITSILKDDVASLVASCSNLQRLDLLKRASIGGVLWPKGLLPLIGVAQSLTHLSVSDVYDEDVIESLVHLRRLRVLNIAKPSYVTDMGLLQLTKLREVTWLKIHRTDRTPSLAPVNTELVFMNADVTSETACWAQVLAHCKASGDPATKAVAWQVAASRAQLRELQQQLDSQQQECSWLRQEVSNLQEQLVQSNTAAQEHAHQTTAMQAQLDALQQQIRLLMGSTPTQQPAG